MLRTLGRAPIAFSGGMTAQRLTAEAATQFVGARVYPIETLNLDHPSRTARELAEGADHEEGENAADGVCEGECRAAHGNASARAEEETCADGTANGDHLHVTWFEGFVVARICFIHVLG